MSLLRHTDSRLHVGYRSRDWKAVYYAPIDRPNSAGECELGLYCRSTGNAGPREPMDGEIKWHPWFDPANMETRSAREKVLMQKQILTDTWHLLATEDEGAFETMVRGFGPRTGFSRWICLLKEIRRFKRTQFGPREREGEEQEEEDDDSAFEEESEGEVEWERMKEDVVMERMGPPLTPASASRKARKTSMKSSPYSTRTSSRKRRASTSGRSGASGIQTPMQSANSDANSSSGLLTNEGVWNFSNLFLSACRPSSHANAPDDLEIIDADIYRRSVTTGPDERHADDQEDLNDGLDDDAAFDEGLRRSSQAPE